ncbi:hypothetical protein C8A05DRAFT_33498 [Staphylotrichum tortipilum]|uniref:Uncharacterized protein n=1 Tax=Staphylotrichum tortipilum TaxID=2831512 RepID=A0AAN6MLR9_9PEZI|nr:hypothetical protein C8A05DRAFT_33498 [Staphylotrichum longicolle]
MAPTNYHTGFRERSEFARQAEGNNCSGWNCLSDAAQVGIILVVVAFVGVLGYLYWRFKIKPAFAGTSDQNSDSASVIGRWEVTRQEPNSISITISRESRPRQPTPAPAATESRNSLPARTTKQDTRPTRQDETNIELMPSRLGAFGASETHLLPPPPPLPSVWTVPVLPTVPPPADFGPSAFFPPPPFPPPPFPPPPPPPQYSNPIGLGATAASFPPSVPPPYFGYSAPQTYHAQGTSQANSHATVAPQAHQAQDPNPANAQPPVTPPSGPSSDERARNIATSQSAPVASGQNPRRGWFSFLRRSATVGHARTLSSPSPPESQTRSPSPPSPVSSSSSDNEEENVRRQSKERESLGRESDERENVRRQSGERSQPSPRATPSTNQPLPRQRAPAPSGQPLPRQRPRERAQGQRDGGHPVQSESGASSRFANSSVEAQVHDESAEDEPLHHPSTDHRSPSRSCRPSPPSPDMSFPPAEPHRARVAFTLLPNARAVRIGSLPTTDARRAADAQRQQQRQLQQRREARVVSRPEEEEEDGGGRCSGDGYREERDAPGRRGDEGGEGGEQRRGVEEGQRGLVERVLGAFWRARRALREE